MRNDDVNIRRILQFLGCLVVGVAVSCGGLWLLTAHFEARARRADPRPAESSLVTALSSAQPYFPGPREQPAPRADLEALRAREDAELNSYGWIDRSTGVVRIPIDRAMDLLIQAQKGPP